MATYQFRDVNENIAATPIPAEAMQINGVYLETEIVGYRTLYVKGREALSPELETLEIGTRDGSIRKSKRYPARIITVGYQLMAADDAAFRESYNKLGNILNVDDAEIIFNDEQDKFFIGTPTLVDDVDPGTNSVKGEIEITCLDPLKYSVVEYEAETSIDDPGTLLVDYGGTYKAYPILEADFYDEVETDDETTTELTGNGDCGYVAFFTENEKIIQLGDPDEEDGQTIEGKSETLVSQTFSKTTDWGTAAKALWSQNAGVVVPSDVEKTGTIGMKVATYTVPAKAGNTSARILSSAKSNVGGPYIFYSVSLQTSGRTTNAVTVRATITASLQYDQSWFGTGYGLRGSLYIGGAWRNVTIKSPSAVWRGRTAHTVNMSFTVTGLSGSSASLTGIKFKVERTDSHGTTGTLNERACSNMPVSTYTESVPATYYLGASAYGTAAGKWHGPTIKRTIASAQDFTVSWQQRMSIGNGSSDTRQMGAFQVTLADASNKVIAGIRVLKSKAGKNASLVFYVNGKNVYTGEIDLSYGNKYFGNTGSSSITKTGAKVSFNIGGYTKVFTDSAIADLAVTQLTICFEQYASINALTHNGLTQVKFVKHNRDTWQDIPNKFSTGDVLEADCSAGEIYLNGNRAPELGALGNDWETFCLVPGLNQIGVAYSSWVAAGYEPTFKVRYREVFL